MGIFLSCCGRNSYSDVGNEVDQLQRRQQMLEAAEKRRKEQEARGVKDPEALKQRQRRMEELERKQEMAGNTEGGLRWQVG